MAENTITTNECEDCKYGTVDYLDKARLPVYCSYKDKTYTYGQRIPCDYYEKKSDTQKTE